MAADRLNSRLSHWIDIGCSPQVLEWIKEGIDIPFHSLPEPFELANHSLSPLQTDFVDGEIDRLVHNGAIEICDYKPSYISPIGCVPKRTGKYRLIIDLRHLNSYLSTPSYRNEDIREASKTIRAKDYFVSLDIKDGFHHIPVKDSCRDYLGFKWRGQYYRWRSLPFGMSCSPYFFAKVLRPVVAYLRSIGLRVTLYVDDFLLAACTQHITDQADQLVHTLEDKL